MSYRISTKSLYPRFWKRRDILIAGWGDPEGKGRSADSGRFAGFLAESLCNQKSLRMEIHGIIRNGKLLPHRSLNEAITGDHEIGCGWFLLKRDDHRKKTFFIQLIIKMRNLRKNTLKLVNQLEIQGFERRNLPRWEFLYVNGLPLVFWV